MISCKKLHHLELRSSTEMSLMSGLLEFFSSVWRAFSVMTRCAAILVTWLIKLVGISLTLAVIDALTAYVILVSTLCVLGFADAKQAMDRVVSEREGV